MDKSGNGALLCARYAFPPNQLHFCGPEKQHDLEGYLKENHSDIGLIEILNKFETVYPYLQFIAGLNHQKDPFHTKVVEAYWIGNSYLDKVIPQKMYTHVLDSLQYQYVYGPKGKKIASYAAFGFPHHSFHVMNIFMRSGNLKVAHTLSTIDECRIRFGKIVAINTNKTYQVTTDSISMSSSKLVIENSCTITVTANETYDIGEIVSVHWGHICGKLTRLHQANLHHYTLKSLEYANKNEMQELEVK
jgi:hypothetical protein